MPFRVLVMGLGPIGAAVARQIQERAGFELVAAVDVDPAKVGRDVGEVAGFGRKARVLVSDALGVTLRRSRPDAAVLCTASSLRVVRPQIEALLRHGVAVVSTTEELAYPWFAQRALARRLDAAAKTARVAVVGTGVNPGFAMDALPLTLTAVCERVDAIRVDRVQDARARRLPFQAKIGAGLTVQEFETDVRAGRVRHVGLTESIAMIADALGWRLDRVTDEIAPKIAEAAVASELLTVEPGRVSGIVQDGIGYAEGRAVVRLHMEAYLGAPESFDEVRIDGSPSLHVKAIGGYPGDVATASIVVNTIPRVLQAAPGLHTMRSLALPCLAAPDRRQGIGRRAVRKPAARSSPHGRARGARRKP